MWRTLFIIFCLITVGCVSLKRTPASDLPHPAVTEVVTAPTEHKAPIPKVVPMPYPKWVFAKKKLKTEKFSAAFIKALGKEYDSRGFEEVVRLNVILYLKKSDVHGPQITEQAIDETSVFARQNKETLTKAQGVYGVSGKVVSSLLWLESRYGKNSGHFHVPSVFVDLLQAPRKEVQNYLLGQMVRYTDTVTQEKIKDVISRTRKKSEFALRELHALEGVYKQHWKIDSSFRGSYSGAFGMPQFLPSSYIRYAQSKIPGAQPALDAADDAILSVAFYLKENGWQAKVPDSQLKALLNYNNSLDYAKAILALSEKL